MSLNAGVNVFVLKKKLGKITPYWLCAFFITITMAKFSCSVLSTLHWQRFTRGFQNIYICCIYTQGVSLYLRHNLKSKLIHKIQTRHCKQSHAMSYIPQHYDTTVWNISTKTKKLKNSTVIPVKCLVITIYHWLTYKYKVRLYQNIKKGNVILGMFIN